MEVIGTDLTHSTESHLSGCFISVKTSQDLPEVFTEIKIKLSSDTPSYFGSEISMNRNQSIKNETRHVNNALKFTPGYFFCHALPVNRQCLVPPDWCCLMTWIY